MGQPYSQGGEDRKMARVENQEGMRPPYPSNAVVEVTWGQHTELQVLMGQAYQGKGVGSNQVGVGGVYTKGPEKYPP